MTKMNVIYSFKMAKYKTKLKQSLDTACHRKTELWHAAILPLS